MATFYLSSTYEDLKEHREQVSDELRNMGHQVVGMENYTAAGAAPLARCLADVAKCDAYIGIFAWRYGYIPEEGNPDGKSITELEYCQAIDVPIETLIFILDENAPWYRRFTDEGKKKEQIERLRQSLATKHQVGFFENSDELTRKVMAAVARFVHEQAKTVIEKKKTESSGQGSEKPIIDAPPLPIPPKPRPWKWYALAAFPIFVLGLVLIWIVLNAGRKSPPKQPDEYPSEKKYQFLISEKASLPGIWHLQPGQWDLERGEGEDENIGALLIKGNQMATPKDLGPRVFYNYQADFKLRFKAGDKAAWVLRAQSDGQSGYLFELRKDKGTLFIKGWILRGNKITDALPGDKILRYSTCCKLTDAIHLIADVTDNPQESTRIKYLIELETDFGFSTDDSYKTDRAEFIDSNSTFPWGTIGLLVTDGITQPATTGGILRIEYVTLTPLPKNGSPDSSSKEGISR